MQTACHKRAVQAQKANGLAWRCFRGRTNQASLFACETQRIRTTATWCTAMPEDDYVEALAGFFSDRFRNR